MKSEMFDFIEVYTTVVGDSVKNGSYKGSYNTYEKAYDKMDVLQNEFAQLGECFLLNTISGDGMVYERGSDGKIKGRKVVVDMKTF